MVQILLSVVDLVNPSSIYLDTKLPKAGDVITTLPDGAAWGVQELTNPKWRILNLPNVSAAAVANLLSSEVSGTQPSQASPSAPTTLQFRGFKIDIANVAIPAVLAAYLADATRAAPIFTSGLTGAAIAAYVTKRAPVPDPSVIGQTPSIIE